LPKSRACGFERGGFGGPDAHRPYAALKSGDIKAFDLIRELFAKTPGRINAARQAIFPSTFRRPLRNLPGDGTVTVEIQFLAD
jgi:hypothetical protein